MPRVQRGVPGIFRPTIGTTGSWPIRWGGRTPFPDCNMQCTYIWLRRRWYTVPTFQGFSRRGSVRFNRTVLYDFASNKSAPHRRILENKIRTAPHHKQEKNVPHRTIGLSKKKCTAPHRRVWWQSVKQAFLTLRIELIRRKKRRAPYRRTMRTVLNVTIYTKIRTQNCRIGENLVD